MDHRLFVVLFFVLHFFAGDGVEHLLEGGGLRQGAPIEQHHQVLSDHLVGEQLLVQEQAPIGLDDFVHDGLLLGPNQHEHFPYALVRPLDVGPVQDQHQLDGLGHVGDVLGPEQLDQVVHGGVQVVQDGHVL